MERRQAGPVRLEVLLPACLAPAPGGSGPDQSAQESAPAGYLHDRGSPANIRRDATRILSYRVFFFTLYSLGLRLGEGLRLQFGDIDATRARVHIRDAKGNKDHLVPLP